MTHHNSPRFAPDSRRWIHLGYALIGALLIWRLFYTTTGLIELSPDEALYWLQSKHPALSYYSKPPMTAGVMYLGTALFGDNDFGVRFFSPVIAAILSVVCLRFCARELNARLGFALVLVTNATPLLMVGSVLMTIDPLSVLFWTLAMLAGWKAIQTKGCTKDWLWVGVWMGLGFLSKYTALFQWLSWATFFFLWRPARQHLRRPGPYLALLANLIVALPVLIWNAQNDWVTVTHVGGRADFGNLSHFTLRYFFEFLGAEAGLLNPVFFAGMIWAAVAFWRSPSRDLRMVYLFSMGAPIVAVYTLQSFHARVLPNWIVPAVLPFMLLMLLFWENRWQQSWVRKVFYLGLGIGLVAMVFLTDTGITKLITGHNLPITKDPLRRIRGWQEMARITGEARANLLKEGTPVFIICPDYGVTSEITFYLPGSRKEILNEPTVCCWDSDKPISEFYFWPGYDFWKRTGQNAIYVKPIAIDSHSNEPVTNASKLPNELTTRFRSVVLAGRYHADFRGQPVRWFELFECKDLLQR